jgi:cytochrome P450
LVSADPPEHTRLRRIVDRQFLPRAIAQLEPRVRAIIDSLLDPILERGRADLVADLAAPLPLIVIAEVLGVEPERQRDFKRWSDDLLAAAGGADETTRARTEETGVRWPTICAPRRDRRANPRPGATDIISTLVTASDRDALSTSEVIAFCMLLLVAGNETTTNTVANGALAIMEQPDQWRSIMRDPALVPSFVEESLRYDSAIQGFFRTARTDAEVAAIGIPAGARVLVLFGSANRDDHHYRDPDTFTASRNPLDHLPSARDPLCLGAHLARLELKPCRRLSHPGAPILPDGGPAYATRSPGVHRLPVGLIV